MAVTAGMKGQEGWRGGVREGDRRLFQVCWQIQKQTKISAMKLVGCQRARSVRNLTPVLSPSARSCH